MTVAAVVICLLAGCVCGGASAEAWWQRYRVTAVLLYLLGIAVAWVGVTQL